jgi:dUTP pyrophosphatase
MNIKVINKSNNDLPEYSTALSAGMDIRASLKEKIVIRSGERKLIPTGLFFEIPEGYEVQVRPRSGLAIKHGITVLNSPGTVDADYRGEVCVILINLGSEDFEINNGDRIAQMIVSRFEQCSWVEVEALNSTERGSGGFGHTGK